MKLTFDQRRKRTSDGMVRYYARRRRVSTILHGHRISPTTFSAIENASFDDLVYAVKSGFILDTWRRELIASRITDLVLTGKARP